MAELKICTSSILYMWMVLCVLVLISVATTSGFNACLPPGILSGDHCRCPYPSLCDGSGCVIAVRSDDDSVMQHKAGAALDNSSTLVNGYSTVKHTHTPTSCIVRKWSAGCPNEICYYTTCQSEDLLQAHPWWPYKSQELERKYWLTYGAKACRSAKPQRDSLSQRDFSCDSLTLDDYDCPLQSQAGNHLMAFPEHKILFCGHPKNGITGWLRFFRYMLGAKDYSAMPYYKMDVGRFLLRDFPQEEAVNILNDPTYTKGVLFRDPAERLLSAYLDKILRNGTQEGYAKKIFGLDRKLPFSEFVEFVSREDSSCTNSPRYGAHQCTDPHWRPQVYLCGLNVLLPKFDFIGNFSKITEFTESFLSKAGLWEEFGSTYKELPPGNCRNKKITDDELEDLQQGFNKKRRSNEHSTSSSSLMDAYYTPALLAKVRKAYAMDYVVWDKIGEHTNSSFIRGSEFC
eukprot:m.184495 g.184495  ORF g.184495 m.184495 type:complete len:458 (+) comp32193_c0_seq1:224-1597(+)